MLKSSLNLLCEVRSMLFCSFFFVDMLLACFGGADWKLIKFFLIEEVDFGLVSGDNLRSDRF